MFVVRKMKEAVQVLDDGVTYVGNNAKEYLKENWKPLACGAGTVVGVVAIVYITRGYGSKIVIVSKMPLLGEKIPSEGRNIIMNRPIFKKSPVYNITNNFGAPVNRLSRVVECVETGQITPSIAEMAREMNVSASQLCRHLSYPEMYPSVKGYHFQSKGYAIPIS